MVNQDLLNYIRDTLKQGFSRDQIRDALLNAGWRMEAIKDAFDCLKEAEDAKVVIKSGVSIKKKLAGFAAAGAVFLFIASSAFGGYYYYSTIPARTLERIKESADEIKTFKFEANLIFSSKDADIQIISSGAADVSNEAEKLSYSKHNFDLDVPESEISASAEIKSIKDTSYLRLNFPEAEDPSFAAMVEMAGIQNKWVKIDSKEIEQFISGEAEIPSLETGGKDVPVLLPKTSWLSPLLAANILDIAGAKYLAGHPLSGETKDAAGESGKEAGKSEELEDIIKNYHLFKVSEYAGKEIVQGVKTRHIKFELDKNELFQLILDRYQESSDNSEKYQKEITEALEYIKLVSGDIWAGKDDGYLYRLALNILAGDEETGDSELKFAIEFSDFNKPVSVEAPKEAESILDVLERMGLVV